MSETGSLAGTQLAPRQIALMAFTAGWTNVERLATAVAVALQESGGWTQATNVNPDGSIDRGLWQINSKAHPEVTEAQAFDPVWATAYAYQVYQGRSYTFNAWAAFTSGAYKKQANHASAAVCNFIWQHTFGQTGTLV